MARFKTRARTLDMLGRQQIAGIPNAINELFKNAHDAYAERVVVDYYRKNRLFVLRDDGFGMTEKDFRDKWLTLGTESKMVGKQYIPRNRKERPIMGEKGIGRLSVATLGCQVVVLTRANRDGIFSDLVCAFIHWGIFECPEINLDEIDIPIKIFPGGLIPSKDEIDEMLDEFSESISPLASRNTEAKEIITKIIKEISRIKGQIDPKHYSKGNLSLKENGSGTHFYIMPADESLDAAIDEKLPGTSKQEITPPLIRSLLGFSNTMKEGTKDGSIKTHFYDHRIDGTVEDLIIEEAFFTPEEFVHADHHIEGAFDEFGQFTGKINIFGKKEYENHVISWLNRTGQKTDCGPFKISVAIIQPEEKTTSIPIEQHAIISAKAQRLGSVYVYKDDIRILPYGNVDVDWLMIEYRRTKSAGFYFFSHRNLFGYVDISQKKNPNLKEKAGREGFRENKAYRQLREILTNFFIQLAADFFRSNSLNSEWNDYARANEKRYKTLQRREKRLKGSKQEFCNNLEQFFFRINNNGPHDEGEALLKKIADNYRKAFEQSGSVNVVNSFIDVGRDAYKEFDDWRTSYEIKRPKNAAFKKSIEEDWVKYQSLFIDLDNNLFQPTRKQLDRVAKEAQQTYDVLIDQRQRFEASLNDLIRKKEQESSAEGRVVRQTVVDLQKNVSKVINNSLAEVQQTARQVMAEFSKADLTNLDDSEQVEIKIQLEDKISKIAYEAKETLVHIREQLQGISLNTGETQTLSDEIVAIEAEYLALKEEKTKDIELMQMGQAVSVIQHEFNSQVIKIRDSIRVLKSWADLNAKLQPVYGNLRTSFEHLDGYLNLFAPLQRRMKRAKEDIYGHEILSFISDLFKNRFERHHIELKHSLPFKSMKQLSYRSVFYPVFVNLIDNAIFWLKDRPLPRTISLDYRERKIFVKDNGPGISPRDNERIFSPGFSRKPGGAGLGLYIVKEALKGVDCTIDILQSTPDSGACFVITTKPDGQLL